ncbi:MAG: Asp-tRNA(Asn)/Glu-tRNA(Gln) amidotransferase subunit GatC [Candidatus Nanohalobium sp.]
MVDAEEVRQVAENARIKVEDGEAENFAEDFEDILEMFETLDEIDTEGVEPAFHPVETGSKAREDEEEETLEKEKVFQNTENEEDGYFKGPSA